MLTLNNIDIKEALYAPFLDSADITPDVISAKLDEIKKSKIANSPWKSKFPYLPDVSFCIAHNHNNIFVKWYVSEDNIKAEYKKINDAVYRDTCVEFFISFGEGYYNIEFNYIGNCLVGYGEDKTKRQNLPIEILETIKTSYMLKHKPNSNFSYFYWELTTVIPIDIFIHRQDLKIAGQIFSCNFYKCGDDLPKPHFLCWNMINAPEPNFHLPEFFGKIHFE
ncbi:carbohydrate-binding family 9-like protein [Pedobacter psychrophilus]|uniref:carbohydrate-binding family 9-like protein n=1 Tax=Pedobacter psychrophilus TaxID=1826909 RepID=UPI000A621C16|nr:carbohydrate-binding family 9-like protein [Pedobacter psychrophilus]